MAADDKDDGSLDLTYYSHLLLNKTKRAGLILIFGTALVVITAVISQHLVTDTSWLVFLPPILIMGVPLILYPPVEEWVYKPWQAKAQKYERHYRD